MPYKHHDEAFYVTRPEPDDAPRCTACGDYDVTCFCAPCNDCATLTQRAALNRANDYRWRCPSCHIRATTKTICGEHPVVVLLPCDLKRTVETPAFTMAELVYQGAGCALFLAACASWWSVLS